MQDSQRQPSRLLILLRAVRTSRRSESQLAPGTFVALYVRELSYNVSLASL